jgi:hypothetical protein
MTARAHHITPVGRRALTRLRLLVATVALIFGSPLATGLDAANRVDIRVWPATSMAPTSFTVRVIIERQAANRWIKVTVESENYFGSSEGQLEGERSSRLRIVQFRDVPAGAYEVRAVVLDQNNDVIGAGHTTAMVIGR